jgi:transglutaminase-like putative cysteine protease
MEQYLAATKIIDCNHDSIQNLARELTCDCIDDKEKAIRLFNYVRDNCRYNAHSFNSGAESFLSSNILEKGEGWCMLKAILLTSLCRAAGIPARFIIASIRNHKISPEIKETFNIDAIFPHTYNNLFLNGRWVKAAPTFHRDMCDKIAVPIVEFNGENDAVLPQTDLQGEPFIEYLDNFGEFSDIPWEMILEIGDKIYVGLEAWSNFKQIASDFI